MGAYLFSFGFIWLRSAGKNVISLIKAVTIVITDNIPNSIVGLNSDKVSIKNPADNIAVVDIIAIPVPNKVASLACL